MTKTHFVTIAFLALLLPCFQAVAQFSLEGNAVDASTQLPLEGVVLGLEGTPRSALSDSLGNFNLANIRPGNYRLRASFVGFFPFSLDIRVTESKTLIVKLEPKNFVSEEVIIQATRSKTQDPTTNQTITKEELEKVNLGQDLPILLQTATSVVSNSDAGAGVGYTGLSIRGSDATRINVTMNGVPVNDAESHGVFWVNMPDFASSVSSVQIQRGVGTSTNGSAAFGASLNIQTNTLEKEPYAETHNSFGSFNTRKNNVLVGTGLMNEKWALDARLSRISSDGFIDRGSSDLKSFFVSAGYYGKKSLLKFNVLSGTEKTYQAWNGIPESRLNGNRQDMLDYISRNYLSSADSANLVNSGSRTYNQFTYKNQTDNYMQTHYQLFYSYDLGRKWGLNTALHYTKGAGYYEEFKPGENNSKYNLPNYIFGTDTLTTTDLIRRRWLDNDFYGATYSLTHEGDKLSFTFGGAANQYKGTHFGEVIWAQISALPDNTYRYYDNAATKTDITNYVKLGYLLSSGWRLYGDLQTQNIQYQFEGYDRNLNPTDQSVNLFFFNPKAGISYQPHKNQLFYLSYGKSQREPVRDDFVNSSPQSRPKPEWMHNGELGWRQSGKRWTLSANYYLMYYTDQLVLTGQINDVGAYIRSNVGKSYRQGVELEAAYKVLPEVQLSGNVTLSRNRISAFNYYLDDYSTGEQKLTVYKDTPIAFSPDLIASGEIRYLPIKNLEAALISKWVGRQYLDNTGNKNKSLDPYQFLNFRASYRIYVPFVKEISVQVLVNNVLNARYEANGYTWGYVYDGQVTAENFYFPQAGRNFLVGVNVRF